MADDIKYNNEIDYFLAGSKKQADMERSAKIAKSIYQEFPMFFFQALAHLFTGKMPQTLPSFTKVHSIYGMKTL